MSVPCGACGAVGAYDPGCSECQVPPEEPLTPADQIQMARRLHGLSRAEAARRTGIPLRTLEDWEAGVRVPKPYSLPGILASIQQAVERAT